MNYRTLAPGDDAALAELIRTCLKAHGLDLPGTVYFDSNLDHLSDFYLANREKRRYYVLTDEDGQLAGGIGLGECGLFPDCAELQKLYLAESMRGGGLSYALVKLVEDAAREMGYRRIYLETHTNLQAAIHVYEKAGYIRIPRPDAVVHSTMNRFYIKDLEPWPDENANLRPNG